MVLWFWGVGVLGFRAWGLGGERPSARKPNSLREVKGHIRSLCFRGTSLGMRPMTAKPYAFFVLLPKTSGLLPTESDSTRNPMLKGFRV